MSLIDIKTRARRAIHGRLAVPVTSYVDEEHPDGLTFGDLLTPPTLTVRYHNKMSRGGNLDGDYAEVIDGIDKLIFLDQNVSEVSAALVEAGQPALVPSRGAEIVIQPYQGLKFILDSQEPPDGPSEVMWVVARSRT